MNSTEAQSPDDILAPALPPLADERVAHLVREARRSLLRALQAGLAEHGIASGHWTFLRILWRGDGVNQRELSELARVQEPTTSDVLGSPP